MRWVCSGAPTEVSGRGYYGHVLVPHQDHEALWSGWRCARCGELFHAPGSPDNWELPLADETEEVDELAPMLDGTRSADRGEDRTDNAYRVGSLGILALVPHLQHAEWAAVAEAILELEANADAWLTGDPPIDNGDLAIKAWAKAPKNTTSAESIATRYFEAAALLRDGWRPKG